MWMNERALQSNGSLVSRLPQLMMALILLQPVLDILSFWQDQAGADNTLTLALRFGMLLVVALAGFCLSGRKRIYVALALVLLGFGLCHAAAVIQVDLQTLPGEREATGFWMLLSDFANYVRVAQIPVFTLCFITFLKRSGEKGFAAIERSFLLVLLIVAAGCVIGVSMGILVCSIGKFSEGIKVGIMLGISMTTSVLAGLVNVQIKHAVDRALPLVNKLNPAAVISDAFYCINVYDDPVRFRNDILTLFIMCTVILAVSFVVVRRERYDSI